MKLLAIKNLIKLLGNYLGNFSASLGQLLKLHVGSLWMWGSAAALQEKRIFFDDCFFRLVVFLPVFCHSWHVLPLLVSPLVPKKTDSFQSEKSFVDYSCLEQRHLNQNNGCNKKITRLVFVPPFKSLAVHFLLELASIFRSWVRVPVQVYQWISENGIWTLDEL